MEVTIMLMEESCQGRKENSQHIMKGKNDQVLLNQYMEVATRQKCVPHRGVGT